MSLAIDYDTAFDTLAKLVEHSFKTAALQGNGHLFTTDSKGLFTTYLLSFADAVERQHHNCNCCHQFIKNFGGLVWIDAHGATIPAMWAIPDELIPEMFRPAITELGRAVSKAKITGVHHSSERQWGTATTGVWNHFAVTPPAKMVHTSKVQTAGQARSYSVEEFGMLLRGLTEFSVTTFNTAVTMLLANEVDRADKFLPILTAQRDLKLLLPTLRNQQVRDAFMWYAVASSPAGFCHVKGSVMGTLLADIEAGTPLSLAKKAFNTKVAPLAYQRATTAPKAGNVQQAEDLMLKLGLAPALPRRFAALLEASAHAVWTPHAPAQHVTKPIAKRLAVQAPGVFANLAPTSAPLSAGATGANTLTLDKFLRTVLPKAETITFTPPKRALPYGALTAAVDPTAPPLFAWDSDEHRNSFSWYKWAALDAEDYGLTPGTSVEALSLIPIPPMWNKRSSLHEGYVLVLTGAAEMNTSKAGSGLFNELLRSELHGVRSTIFAHTMSAELLTPQVAGPLATGLVIRKGTPINITLTVTLGGSTIDYTISTWD